MAGSEIYRVEIPIIVSDETEAPLSQAGQRVSKFEQRARKETEQIRQHFMKIGKMQIEPVMKIRDQLTNSVLQADRLVKRLGMEKATPVLTANDRISGVITQINKAVDAISSGKHDVALGVKADALVQFKEAEKAVKSITGPYTELKGPLLKQLEQTQARLEKLDMTKAEPLLKMRDQLTAKASQAKDMVNKLSLAKVSPIIEAQDRVSAVVTRIDAALKAMDRGDVKVLAEMQGPLMDEIVKAKSALRGLEGVRAGPVAELRGELFGQLTKAMSQIKGLDGLMAQPKATLLDRVSASVRSVSSSLRGLTGRAWSVTLQAKDRVTGVLQGIFRMLTSPLAMVGLVGGGVGLGALIKDFIMTAGRTETLNIAMQSVARATGTSMDELLKYKQAVMDLGIAEQEATLMVTRFMQSQLNLADASKIARAAQDMAVIAGINSSEAAETMVEAVAKLRPELLAQFGMTRNLNDIYGDYAKTIGRSASQLTETQKKQAMMNYILVEAAKAAGTYEDSMSSAFKKLGSLARPWTELKTKIGTPLFLPAFGVFVDKLTDAIKRATEWTERNQQVLERWGRKAADVVGNTVGRVENFLGRMAAKFKDPGFQELDWGGKLIKILEEVATTVEVPAGRAGAEIGLALGRGLGQGIANAMEENAILSLLIGFWVGSKIPGPLPVKITAGVATAGVPLILNAGEKVASHIPGTEPYTERKIEEYREERNKAMEKLHNKPADQPLYTGQTISVNAYGGILNNRVLSWVAEAGPEAIIPLTKPARAWDLWQRVGERMGFFEREKIPYVAPLNITQQRMTLGIPDVALSMPTSSPTRNMAEPLERLQIETKRIITRGHESINRITSVVERVKNTVLAVGTSAFSGPAAFQSLVLSAAAKFNIPVGILSRLISAESSWQPGAVSPAGALGLTQVMPSTARGMGYSVDELRRSPALQIEAGAKYLAAQYARFKNWSLALAAYNAGPGVVTKYGGIPPYRETQNYVTRILSPARHALGGIFTQPHVGLIGEAGPELVMPLSARMRGRALSLYEEAGRMLGVLPHAAGGIMYEGGFTGSVPIAVPALAGISTHFSPFRETDSWSSTNVTNHINVTINTTGSPDPDEIAEKIALKVESVWHNMPKK